MNLIINHSSMQPIYEQIIGQIKEKIMHRELQEDTMLPVGADAGKGTEGQCPDSKEGI